MALLPKCPKHSYDDLGSSDHTLFCLVPGCNWMAELCWKEATRRVDGKMMDYRCVKAAGHDGRCESSEDDCIQFGGKNVYDYTNDRRADTKAIDLSQYPRLGLSPRKSQIVFEALSSAQVMACNCKLCGAWIDRKLPKGELAANEAQGCVDCGYLQGVGLVCTEQEHTHFRRSIRSTSSQCHFHWLPKAGALRVSPKSQGLVYAWGHEWWKDQKLLAAAVKAREDGFDIRFVNPLSTKHDLFEMVRKHLASGLVDCSQSLTPEYVGSELHIRLEIAIDAMTSTSYLSDAERIREALNGVIKGIGLKFYKQGLVHQAPVHTFEHRYVGLLKLPVLCGSCNGIITYCSCQKQAQDAIDLELRDRPTAHLRAWGTGNAQTLDVVSAVYPSLVAQQIVNVQPMTAPSGLLFYLDYKYGSTTPVSPPPLEEKTLSQKFKDAIGKMAEYPLLDGLSSDLNGDNK